MGLKDIWEAIAEDPVDSILTAIIWLAVFAVVPFVGIALSCVLGE